jgi:hypothetical protein
VLRLLSMILAVSTPCIIGAEEIDPGQAGQLYPEAPGFTLQPRNAKLKFEDCSRCHEEGDTDPEPRRLKTRHVREIDHGGNRFWCLTCHDGGNMDYLRTSGNEKIDFDQSYLICGSCHADRQKDWYFGGHGKRVSGWQDERVILVCTECHDPHKPAVEPRPPKPPPPVRIGLERQAHQPPDSSRVWERYDEQHGSKRHGQ